MRKTLLNLVASHTPASANVAPVAVYYDGGFLGYDQSANPGDGSFSVADVPESATLLSMLAGLGVVGAWTRPRRAR